MTETSTGEPLARRAWRSTVRARTAALRTAAAAAAAAAGCTVSADGETITPGRTPQSRQAAVRAQRVLACCAQADQYAADQRLNPVHWLTGSRVEGAWTNVHAAEEHLLEVLTEDELRGYVPLVAYEVRRLLRRTDPRRVAVERRAAALASGAPVTAEDVALLTTALRGVHYANAMSYIRVRSLRNIQLGFAGVFVVLAVALALLGSVEPDTFSLCLTPDAGGMVCPTGAAGPSSGDVALVELVGLVGAAAAAARSVTGTSRPTGPYSVVVGQAVLKTVLGAVTAVLGVWFLAAGAVPGVDVDTRAEILVYAAVFGYAQQLLTGLIDQRAEAAATGTPAPRGRAATEPEPSAESA